MLRQKGKGVTVLARLMGEDQLISSQQTAYREHQGRVKQAWEEFHPGNKTAMDLLKTIVRVHSPITQ